MPEQPQHMQALNHANRLRFKRAALKAWVREPAEVEPSRQRLASLLDQPVPPELRTLMIEDFLRWAWHTNPSRVSVPCRLAHCHGGRPMGQLTDRQRRVIAGALRMSAIDLQRAKSDQDVDMWIIERNRRAA